MKKTVLILTLITVHPWIRGDQLDSSGVFQALERQVKGKIMNRTLTKTICVLMARRDVYLHLAVWACVSLFADSKQK